MDIKRDDAIDGAQFMIIVGTLIITKNMERTAQDAPKVLDIKNIFEVILTKEIIG